MKTAEQIANIIEDLHKIQHGAWPSSYVEAVLDDADSALNEYKLFLTDFEKMSSDQKKIFYNIISGMLAL